MKRFLLLVVMLIGLRAANAVEVQEVVGVSGVSQYFDWGGFYSGSSFPVDVAKDTENTMPAINELKRGEAVTTNIFGLVEVGDRGIQKAAKNGGIKKIHYVDSKIDKVYIPLVFIPIYMKQVRTTVYGE